MMKKVYWTDVASIVKEINKEFFDLMAPFSTLKIPLYVAKYRYGQYFGKGSKVYLPSDNGQLYRLGGKETPNDVVCDLGYGKNSLPLAMILDKYCEWNGVDPISKTTYPKLCQGPGTICNQDIIFEQDISDENSKTSACAGVQTAFLLPYIGCKKSHSKIQSDFNTETKAPRSYQDHSCLFNELLNKNINEHNWTASILYFSEHWIDKIRNDRNFGPLREYFLKNLLLKEKAKNPMVHDGDPFLSSNIANELKPTPFTIDSARYLFNLVLGSGVGFIPATTNNHLPLATIQDIYTRCYQIKYTPTV